MSFVCFYLIYFQTIMPGPPFAFGAVLVILALLVAIFIPEGLDRGGPKSPTRSRSSHTPAEKYALSDLGMSPTL